MQTTINKNTTHFLDLMLENILFAGPQCTENNIRLRGGSSALEGRIEICLGGTWGTVCDDGWSGNDATVACRQLGTQLGISLGGEWVGLQTSGRFNEKQGFNEYKMS